MNTNNALVLAMLKLLKIETNKLLKVNQKTTQNLGSKVHSLYININFEKYYKTQSILHKTRKSQIYFCRVFLKILAIPLFISPGIHLYNHGCIQASYPFSKRVCYKLKILSKKRLQVLLASSTSCTFCSVATSCNCSRASSSCTVYFLDHS